MDKSGAENCSPLVKCICGPKLQSIERNGHRWNAGGQQIIERYSGPGYSEPARCHRIAKFRVCQRRRADEAARRDWSQASLPYFL